VNLFTFVIFTNLYDLYDWLNFNPISISIFSLIWLNVHIRVDWVHPEAKSVNRCIQPIQQMSERLVIIACD